MTAELGMFYWYTNGPIPATWYSGSRFRTIASLALGCAAVAAYQMVQDQNDENIFIDFIIYSYTSLILTIL